MTAPALSPARARLARSTSLSRSLSRSWPSRCPRAGAGAPARAARPVVQFYAAAVFASFLGALLASTVLSRRERRPFATAIAAGGTLAVAVVLVLNLRRLDPIRSLGTAAIVSVYLWRSWVAHGPPGGIPSVAT